MTDSVAVAFDLWPFEPPYLPLTDGERAVFGVSARDGCVRFRHYGARRPDGRVPAAEFDVPRAIIREPAFGSYAVEAARLAEDAL